MISIPWGSASTSAWKVALAISLDEVGVWKLTKDRFERRVYIVGELLSRDILFPVHQLAPELIQKTPAHRDYHPSRVVWLIKELETE
jgi:hypothetical protein